LFEILVEHYLQRSNRDCSGTNLIKSEPSIVLLTD